MLLLLPLLLAAVIQIPSPVWTDAPPSMPAGSRMAVLEGNPKEAGLFTIRLRLPAGASIAPHTHPRPERVTVLSGRVLVSIGGKETAFSAGGFYVNPPDVPHSLTFAEETILQLTCDGPWELRYVK